MSIKSKTFTYVALLFLLFARPAHAYLDPGTGSYLFQFLIAGILGGSFFLKGSIKSLFDRFRKSPGQTSSTKSSKGNSLKDDDKKD